MTSQPNVKPAPGGSPDRRLNLALSAPSWQLIEEPIRHGAIGRAWARVRAAGWGRLVKSRPDQAGRTVAPRRGRRRAVWRREGRRRVGSVASQGGCSCLSRERSPRCPRQPQAPARHRPRTRRPSQLHSCRAVAHLGDSTSTAWSRAAHPPVKPAECIAAQYTDVGAQWVITDIRPPVVRGLPGRIQMGPRGDPIRGGFRGCWVLALGTQPTADVAAGSMSAWPRGSTG